MAECRRFLGQPLNLLVLGIYVGLLLLGALWALLQADQLRSEQMRREGVRAQALAQGLAPPLAATLPAAAMQAFTLGRSQAGLAQLSPAPGLVLSVSPFHYQPTAIAVSVESRHGDGRRSGVLDNPLLGSLGSLDLGLLISLLMPLAAIGLAAASLAEHREQGLWRLVCCQSASPWLVLTAGMLIQALALGLPALLICAVALLRDAGVQGWATALLWGACLLCYALFWSILVHLLGLLRLASGASVMVALAAWLGLTFGLPAAAQAWAAHQHPIPSRLGFVVELRQAQQQAEEAMPALLSAWYARHPAWQPVRPQAPAWPVSFLPRFEQQDARLRAAAHAFIEQRVAQTRRLKEWAWAAPPLALWLAADQLAGIGPARYAGFMWAVDEHEAAWRGFFVPRIMSYRGLAQVEASAVPVFGGMPPPRLAAALPLLGALALAVLGVGLIWSVAALRLAGRP
ncbi:Domain of uncharacterised function (DUF3526) [Bordetella trematum]|uniref:Domain of uncharacterized function (DUF3526) n=1 Tax=Bordetella trematum TaxID=123899 RepID=A0A157LG78_9BORD|nr:Domain of uncharacterised function (DUF3526) [Bordetella trematum]SAI74204.1 Domain of uncharacterised function (DUF3526) [Bordetella trematum]SUV96949.1 Domain of uncharacterised function (DUF3526) [Bordetella trematum]